jgi:hypothetical protein
VKLEGELLTVQKAAQELRLAASTVHRWLQEGVIQGEQLTPGAPWRIRITANLRQRIAEEAPEGYLTMFQTMRLLGVSRQTVLQREAMFGSVAVAAILGVDPSSQLRSEPRKEPVKRGEIEAVHVRCGRQKGLRLKVIQRQQDLFGAPIT